MPPKEPQWLQNQRSYERELAQLLFAHGDIPHPLPSTIKTFDSIVTDYIIQICFGAAQSASLHNRAKVKIDDVLFALRKNPGALGRIEEMQEKQKSIAMARKAVVDPDKTEELGGMVEVGKGGAGGAGVGGEGGDGDGKKGKGKKRKGAGDGELGRAFKKNLKGAFA